MGKRSDFKRIARDAYDTPIEAVIPLLPHLAPGTRFIEPCAGKGHLIDHLEAHGHKCVLAYDIEPTETVMAADALALKPEVYGNECFLTNPPWDRKILHPLITHLSDQAPCWLLFDADWAHTKQASPFKDRLKRVVSVGRIKWIPGTNMTGKDNCAWHLFDRTPGGGCQLYLR